jgi:3-hydroxyisobutyrate dehydrogenase-like beta-hydroxyacid dehydrogenase
MTRVAVIGLGVMGRAAASALVGAGHEVAASDPSPDAGERASELGAGFENTPDRAVQDAKVALMFLPGPDQVRSVVTGDNGILAAGPSRIVIVDHSTSDPVSAREMADLVEAEGDGWIDAPILGRPSAVGRWALPIGATEGALANAGDVLKCYAGQIFEVGGPGAGHTIKLLNQMMFGAINAMTAEMMAASEKLGVPPAQLYEIITASQAGTVSNLFKELGGRISENRYASPTFSTRLLEKDVRLGLEMARQAGVETALGRVVAQMNEQALDRGLGDLDSSAMWKGLRDV